jgi:hypothetical protein
MKLAAHFALALLLPASANVWAGEWELAVAKPVMLQPVDLGPARDNFGRPLVVPGPQTPFARAMNEAWKKDASEANLKAWSEVLIKCQQATNPAWTTVLMRSEPQQAHCYRY